MTDTASFDRVALQAIYGEYPACFVCPRYKGVDPHHIHGRGGKHNRKLMSSVFNCAMLSRDVHETCPFINNPEFQWILCQHAIRHVNHAIAKGDYEATETDIAFLDFIRTKIQ